MLTFSCFADPGPSVCSSAEFNECTDTDYVACRQKCLENGDECQRSCYATCEEKDAAKELSCSKDFDCELEDYDAYKCYELCTHEIAIECYDGDDDVPSCMWCFRDW